MRIAKFILLFLTLSSLYSCVVYKEVHRTSYTIERKVDSGYLFITFDSTVSFKKIK